MADHWNFAALFINLHLKRRSVKQGIINPPLAAGDVRNYPVAKEKR
jgi:hypothetical protein